jgi:hypothetical protein
LEDIGLNWRIILKYIFKKPDGGYRLDWSGSEYGQVTGSCKCGSEPSGFIKRGEFLDWLRVC